ncbi:MAG: tRNA (adenosine(37)-N6)-threonylcarbamoyltransferase complex ATPase subunit type 1 TsaE [Gelidibacter sp.]
MERTYHIDQIEAIAADVLHVLNTKAILLIGEMGVGKTTFVKALVKVLGGKDEVSSPTFSIVNDYELPNDRMYHFDLYRIKDEGEALQFGIEDYLSSGHWIVMEWPEKIPNLLPEHVDTIELILNKDHSRTLKLNTHRNLTKKYGNKLQKL